MPQKFNVATGDNWINGVLIDVDEDSGRSRSITRINKKADIDLI